VAFSKVAPCVSLHFAKISLHLPKMQGGDRFDRDCIRQPMSNLLITWLFLLLRSRRFHRHLAHISNPYASPIAAETKCTRHLSASDDENLSVGISWLTFLLQSSEQ